MKNKLEKNNFPSNWDILPFCDAIQDKTGGNQKIKQSDYQPEGALAIVDQGSKTIGGYTDNLSAKAKVEIPVIIFGDHSKIFKLIEFPFVLGADGAKILVPSEEFDTRFVFHYLRTLRLPDNAGYSRHFKFLKDHFVPKPPLEEQKRIAAILDKADNLRRKRQQTIDLANQFLRSVFLDMFGDPESNLKKWMIVELGKLITSGPNNGLYKPSNFYGKGVPILRIDGFYNGYLKENYNYKKIEVEKKELERFRIKNRSIIVNRVNSREYLGKSALVEGLEHETLFESNMMNFEVNELEINPRFLVDLLSSSFIKRQILRRCKDAVNQSSINQQDVKSLQVILPPISLQNDYEKIVDKVTKSKTKLRESVIRLNHLQLALSQKAFSGNL